jgi:hypothetical protein
LFSHKDVPSTDEESEDMEIDDMKAYYLDDVDDNLGGDEYEELDKITTGHKNVVGS